MAKSHWATSSHANIRSVVRTISCRCASKRASARRTTASAAALIASIDCTEELIVSLALRSFVVRLREPRGPAFVQGASEHRGVGAIGRRSFQERGDPLPPETVAFVAARRRDSAVEGELAGGVVEDHRARSLHAESPG